MDFILWYIWVALAQSGHRYVPNDVNQSGPGLEKYKGLGVWLLRNENELNNNHIEV